MSSTTVDSRGSGRAAAVEKAPSVRDRANTAASATALPGLPVLADVDPVAWEALARRRIFFGHQSVGRNIMDGVRDILQDHPEIGLRVVQTDDASSVSGPAFIEGRVGANRDPASKTDAFARVIERSFGAGDIALHKYCYVDVGRDTNVEQLFGRYATAMSELARVHPDVTFVHVTVPLTTSRGGPGQQLRTLLGRPTEIALNLKRGRFNQLMRETYAGREPLFDLALLESITSEGLRSHTRYGSRTVYRLAPEWTYDNGHLNEAGRRLVAEQLLILLAGLPGAPHAGAPLLADAPGASA